MLGRVVAYLPHAPRFRGSISAQTPNWTDFFSHSHYMSYDPIIFPTKVPPSNYIFTELVAPHQNRNFIALVGYRRTGKSLFASTLKNENTSLYVYEDLDYKDGKKKLCINISQVHEIS